MEQIETAATYTRFDLHWQKAAILPTYSGHCPPIIEEIAVRLTALIEGHQVDSNGRRWHPQGTHGAVTLAGLKMMLSHGVLSPGQPRKRRNQALKSIKEVLTCLVSRCNLQKHTISLQAKHGEILLTPLQIRPLVIESKNYDHSIAELSGGLAGSTVKTVLKILTDSGILHTKRNKNQDKDKERPASRWFDIRLFEALGLKKQLNKFRRVGEQIALAKANIDNKPKPPAATRKPAQPAPVVNTPERKETARNAADILRGILKKPP